MKVKLLVFAAALLMLSSLSFGQGFVACLYDDATVLSDACVGGAPLPEGTPIVIMHDINGNGPDAADLPAQLCNDPPACQSGLPVGSHNMNTFGLNGDAMGMGPGMFYTDPCFGSIGGMPAVSRYYLKITLADGLTWTSSVFTPVSGPQDLDLTAWTCTPGTPPSCEPVNQSVVFQHGVSGPQDQPAQCATLCAQFPIVTVCVPGLAEGHTPTIIIDHACDCGIAGQASAWIEGGWVYANGAYCETITLAPGAEDGSICIHLDNILAANISDIKALAGDKSVTVNFTALSETNVNRYEVLRNGVLAGRLDAKGAGSYSFVDKELTNGTTYTYTLVMVNTDNTTETFAVGAVAPSMYNAVVTEYALHQNFPNPFNPTTSIRFDLVENNFVSLKVYNANGQEVGTVVNSNRTAGVNVVNFDATNLTSGLYFYTIKVGNVYSATKKMLLVK